MAAKPVLPRPRLSRVPIAKLLAQARYQNRHTLAQVGVFTGVTGQTILNWERGTSVKGRYLPALSRYLGIPLPDLSRMLERELRSKLNAKLAGEAP